MSIKFLKNEKVTEGLRIFSLIFVLYFVVGFGLNYAINFLEERAVDKYTEELQRPYLEDTYGGATPEDTFEMFLSALKDGDVELASKYFVVDKRRSRKEYFQAVVEAGKMDEMTRDLSGEMFYTLSLYKKNKQYEIKNNKGEVIFGSIDFIKNANDVWKLTEL